MKFIKHRPFKARVKVEFPAPDGEGVDVQEFTAHFVALPVDEIAALDVAAASGEPVYLRRVLVGWDGITDDSDGKDAPFGFSPENLETLIGDLLTRAALMTAYFAHLTGAKRGN